MHAILPYYLMPIELAVVLYGMQFYSVVTSCLCRETLELCCKCLLVITGKMKNPPHLLSYL